MIAYTDLDPLVSIQEMEELTGEEVPEQDRPRVLLALAQASSLIRRITGQTLSLVEQDHEVHDGSGSVLLSLDQLPVQQLHQVLLEGDEVPPEMIRVEPASGRLWFGYGESRPRPWVLPVGGWGRYFRLGGGWGWGRQSVEVVYDHGYDPLPADLVGVVLGFVGRALEGDSQVGPVVSETLGPYTYRLQAPVQTGALGFTAEETAILRGYRQRRYRRR